MQLRSLASLSLALLACGARSPLDRDEPADASSDAAPDAAVEAPEDSGAIADATLDVTPRDAGRSRDSAPGDAPAGCDAACAIGQSECDDGGVVSCLDDGTGCGAWNAAAACPTDSVCVDVAGGAACNPLDVEVPRPVGPLSTSRVTSRRPTFRWALAGADDGARVDVCADRSCSTTITSFVATGTSGRPAQPLAPGLYFWRLHGVEGSVTGTATSPVWEVTVPVSDAPVDTSWGTILDIDGDGYADVAVGTHILPDQEQAGAYVYTGSASGLAATPTTLASPMNWYAAYVASAGDLDGDGFPELAVGSNMAFGSAGGMVVFRGGPQWASEAPTVLLGPSGAEEFGAWIESAGDVNDDGYGDLLVSAIAAGPGSATGTAYLYLGSPTGITGPPQILGAGVYVGQTAVTDINGDGFSDIVVSVDRAGGPGAGSAAIDVYLGNASGVYGSPTSIPFSGTISGNLFFVDLAPAGDVNGDGYGDIVADLENTPALTVEVFLGGPGGLSPSPITLPNPGTGEYFGDRLAGVGDIDADGFDDIAVGIGGTFAAREAYVYRGGPSGPSTVPSITLSPPPMTAGGFSDPLAGLGDVNRDGFADVGVGAIQSNVFVYLGAPSGLQATPLTITAPAGSYTFSESLARLDVRAVMGRRRPG